MFRVHESQTHPDDLVLGTSSEVLAIRTEANTADVQVSILASVVVHQMADLLTTVDVEDLRRPVAASRNISAVMAEANTADNTLVNKVVHQVDVQTTHDARIEDRVPVLTLALQRLRQLVQLEIGELIANALEIIRSVAETIVGVRWWWRNVLDWRRRRTSYTR